MILWSGDPLATDCCFFLGRNLPVGFEPAEMIDAHDVAHLEREFHALHPPVIALRSEYIPPIQRISPTLSVLAEIIRRDTSHNFGRQVFFQAENVGVRPNIRTVVANEDCHVSDDANVTASTLLMEGAPLLKEEELDDAAEIDLVGKFLADFRQRLWTPLCDFRGPLVPGDV